MVALRGWILAVGLGCFGAGMMLGSAMVRRSGNPATEDSFDRAYADQLVADYRLSDAQARSLQIVLQAERAEEEAIRLAIAWTELPEPMQRQLLAARARTGKRIRALLDPEQQIAYDRDSQPKGARPVDTGVETDRK
jgi:hypothetical protein